MCADQVRDLPTLDQIAASCLSGIPGRGSEPTRRDDDAPLAAVYSHAGVNFLHRVIAYRSAVALCLHSQARTSAPGHDQIDALIARLSCFFNIETQEAEYIGQIELEIRP